MGSALQNLHARGLIKPPFFVVSNLCYETIMGSVAYGVSSDTSDCDIYGFCIPPKEVLFPHLAGVIQGFGNQGQRFDQYQQHHIVDQSNGNEFDFTIYNIVKYFQLCMECNPNMIDSLFTPENCVKHNTRVAQMVRESRTKFLSKLAWPKFKGYALSQMHKIEIKNPDPGSKRAELVERHGFDTKFAYHTVRLLDECEQILMYEDIDLQRNNEYLKSIRRGEVTEKDIRYYFDQKVKHLEELQCESKLRTKPDEKQLKQLLLNCLEHHYGNLDACVVQEDKMIAAIRSFGKIIDELRVGGFV